MTFMWWTRAILLLLSLALVIWSLSQRRIYNSSTSRSTSLDDSVAAALPVLLAFVLTSVALLSWIAQLIWRSIFD